MPGGGASSEWCLRDLSAAGGRLTGQAEERRVRITGRKSHEQDAWSQGDFVTLEVGGETEEPPRIMQKEPDMRLCDRVSTLEERLGGEESPRGKRVTFTPGEDCTGGAITRNTNRRDPTSGGVSSDVARSAVCSGQTKPLVSGEYNSDEEIECLDSVCMATSETSTPDAQYGAESGPEEGAIVTTIAEIHEPRESERCARTRSIIYLDIAAMTKENRFFVDVRVGPFTYKALLDSGAQCCLAGPRMMRELAERIKPSRALIGYADQNTQPSGGYLPVMLQIDRDAGRIDVECTEILPVEMVLGVDFGRRWRVDISMGRNQWRSGDGPWHNFAKLNDTGSSRCDIVAECAGITVAGGERELVERKIKKLIPDVPPKLGHTDKIVHRIELVEGAKPVCHRTRRMTPKMEKIAHECLQKMREEGIIEVAKSEWNSAPVLVRKSDGSYRFCVDYRDLNKVTKKDGYPCKNMDTILDRLRRARYISKIDLKSAYHQVCLDEDSKAYTAFSVQGSGQYQFLRLPFGLKCAPMTFQRLMDSLFGAEVEPYVFAYLDDIILVTETFEEHVNWLERVIRILLDAKLVVNRDKCEFCCQSVKFLGYVLDSSGLRIDSERVRPIHDYPTPRNVKQVRRLLGMVGWYSRFIKNEAEIKVPLARLLRKEAPFVWGADQERAFETLKQALSEAPVLVRPDFEKEFAIQTDASDYAIGAVLTQEREDGEHPVYYISRVLTPAERNYTVTEKECLAVIWAIEKFRPYVEGYHFKVVTDHRALSWLRNFKDPQGRVARWALKLMEYDFEIVYRKGSLHYVPDALSRAFESDERIEVFAFERVEDEWYIKKLSEVKKSPSKYTNWCIEDGMLYKRSYNALLDPVSNAENSWRLVVPAEQRERVLAESHCLTSSGHLGAKKTYDRLACEYWWPGMWYAVEEYCNSCDVCQRYKVPQTGPKGLMTRRVVDRPWAVVAADMMEFPRSKNQNKYLLVFQDLFTRWIEIVPLRKANGRGKGFVIISAKFSLEATQVNLTLFSLTHCLIKSPCISVIGTLTLVLSLSSRVFCISDTGKSKHLSLLLPSISVQLCADLLSQRMVTG
uniref:RNA-directed DNA polymerase n=1 Tax=Trichogramma kaykai TaxID=54128 RepID=A0ABD2VWW7_9HYME